MRKSIPVIDVFAGPGGLGEGFTSYRNPKSQNPFRIALAVEKDPLAHATLELRSFYRQFRETRVPDRYYRLLRGEIPREELFNTHHEEARLAAREAWLAELGATPLAEVRDRIHRSLVGREPWILIGGPPGHRVCLTGRALKEQGRRGVRSRE